jgi:hypothetical protein
VEIVRQLLHQTIHIVPLYEFVQDYGYEQPGQRVPLLTWVEFMKHFGTDDRARFFFLDLKIPEDFPGLVPPAGAWKSHSIRRDRNCCG